MYYEFHEFHLMNQAIGYSVVAPKNEFSNKLLHSYSSAALKKHKATSNYATMYSNQLIKLINEDRHILLTYFETFDYNEKQESFSFAFAHLDSYENDIIDDITYDILRDLNNNICNLILE